MATTWIKPTYAHRRYQSKATIQRKIKYVTDVGKTDINNFDNMQHENELTAGNSDMASMDGAAAVIAISDYVQNPDKTENSELITGYECFPEHAAEQFSISMDLYEQNTGRKHKDNSRLVYHMRQSFAPGEVDPRIANRIGYELALEFTKGQHAFVVATHTDKKHIHNHVIFNAFNLECDGKFKDPWFSGKRDVARISDKLCKEYGLSVIEVRQGWSDPYHEWEKKQGITEADKEPTKRQRLENVIDICLDKQPKDFKQLFKYMEEYSCYAEKRGKDYSIKTPFSKTPFRLSSLSDEFTEAGIKKRILESMEGENISANIDEGKNTPKIKNTKNGKLPLEISSAKPKELQLIIDIQNSLKATESIGYKKWAEKFNLEQMSQTLIFIEKHQLTLESLENMATQKPKTLANIKSEIEAIDEKLQKISLLQRHIGTYGKTKEIYKQFKQSGNSEHFKEENHNAIADHEAAIAHFNEQGYGFGSGNKLPAIKELREQYAVRNNEKKTLWAKYHEVKNADKEIDNAWANVRTLLNIKDDAPIELLEQKSQQKNAPSL